MGKGTIAGGGADGLYQVTMDYGTAARDARVATITADLEALDATLAALQAALDSAQAAEDALRLAANAAIADYVAAQTAVRDAAAAQFEASEQYADTLANPASTPEEIAAAQAALAAADTAYANAQAALAPALDAYTEAAKALLPAQAETARVRAALDLMTARKVQLTKNRAALTALVMTETVPAWCADLTEDATGEVATIEVPGENALLLIAPAAPVPTAADGALTAREVQSPEQAFWNAAVLPGWQKWKPTYRTGTITSLNVDADTASVTLDAATSSAQGLPINQATTLADVPVVYMECNAFAFEVGDACVVQFTGQDQAAPRVVGFKTNPRACTDFVAVYWEGARLAFKVNEGSFQKLSVHPALKIQAMLPGGTDWVDFATQLPNGYGLYQTHVELPGMPYVECFFRGFNADLTLVERTFEFFLQGSIYNDYPPPNGEYRLRIFTEWEGAEKGAAWKPGKLYKEVRIQYTASPVWYQQAFERWNARHLSVMNVSGPIANPLSAINEALPPSYNTPYDSVPIGSLGDDPVSALPPATQINPDPGWLPP